MPEITEKEYEQFQILKKIWIHSSPEKSGAFFICGEAGDYDELGMPEYISICPAYGLDGSILYKKHSEYSAPEW